MAFLRIILFLLIPTISFAASSECKRWFEESKINPNDKDCEIKCSVASVDMGTFNCPISCPKFCGEAKYIKSQFCRDEVILAAIDLKMMLRSYELAQEAEVKTSELFGYNGWKDESDAFRHYYWTSLLALNYGSEIANIITTAHESCSGDNPDSNMDLKNNQVALDNFRSLKNPTKENLVKAAKDLFQQDKFKVLKPNKSFSVNDIEWR